jgi:hypothetical protein
MFDGGGCPAPLAVRVCAAQSHAAPGFAFARIEIRLGRAVLSARLFYRRFSSDHGPEAVVRATLADRLLRLRTNRVDVQRGCRISNRCP